MGAEALIDGDKSTTALFKANTNECTIDIKSKDIITARSIQLTLTETR